MQARIEQLIEKKLIGKSIRTTLATNNPAILWGSFMPRKKEVQNVIGTELYSVQVYDTHIPFEDFKPTTQFSKWAAIEVTNFDFVPEGMKTFTLPAGLYAVFIHKGIPSDFINTVQYVFREWLPKSIYILDDRPHFEVLGAKYKKNDPSSEEEVYIPIKIRKNN